MTTETTTTKTTIAAFTKTVHIGSVQEYRTRAEVFCKIEFTADGRLSISGVIGPKRNGNAIGGCGQIDGGFEHRDASQNDARTSQPVTADSITFAPGWDKERWFDFLNVWHLYHSNDMQAGCEHQRADGWNKRPIDPSKPTTAYGKHFPAQRSDSWNMLAWVTRSEHPEGLLSHPCPTCGYKYGSAWLRMEVPSDVIEFLRGLPDTDVTPAWV